MGKIKSLEQIEYIKYSCKILAKLLIELKSIIKPEISLLKIDKIAEEYIRDNKGNPSFKGFHGFPNASCISVNEEVIHGIPKDYKLHEGDIVSVDVGMIYKGAYGDTAYTYPVGEISKENKNLLTVTEKALYIGIDKANSSNRVGDISHAIQSFVEKYSYSLVREYCGHGLGENVWEEPSIPNVGQKNSGPKLKENMVIAIEPMVNIGNREIYVKKDQWTVATKDGKYSAHYEHTLLIKKEKAEILTKIN